MAAAPKVSRRKFLKVVSAIAAGTFVDGFWREPRSLRFEAHEVGIRGLGKQFDGYRIALLSDFHLPAKADLALMRAAITFANAFNPDLVALPGDFVHKTYSGVPDFTDYFVGLRARDHIVGTLGNHDHWVDADRVRQNLRTKTKIQLIENCHLIVERGANKLAIGGVGDLWHGVVDLHKTFEGVDSTTPRILLSHNPDFAEEAPREVRVDLQLSGHTHGGEVRFPLGPAPIIPSNYGQKFREGFCKGKAHRVYVTRGIATVSRFRLCCPPEVTGLILRAA